MSAVLKITPDWAIQKWLDCLLLSSESITIRITVAIIVIDSHVVIVLFSANRTPLIDEQNLMEKSSKAFMRIPD